VRKPCLPQAQLPQRKGAPETPPEARGRALAAAHGPRHPRERSWCVLAAVTRILGCTQPHLVAPSAPTSDHPAGRPRNWLLRDQGGRPTSLTHRATERDYGFAGCRRSSRAWDTFSNTRCAHAQGPFPGVAHASTQAISPQTIRPRAAPSKAQIARTWSEWLPVQNPPDRLLSVNLCGTSARSIYVQKHVLRDCAT